MNGILTRWAPRAIIVVTQFLVYFEEIKQKIIITKIKKTLYRVVGILYGVYVY